MLQGSTVESPRRWETAYQRLKSVRAAVLGEAGSQCFSSVRRLKGNSGGLGHLCTRLHGNSPHRGRILFAVSLRGAIAAVDGVIITVVADVVIPMVTALVLREASDSGWGLRCLLVQLHLPAPKPQTKNDPPPRRNHPPSKE
ncbi:hypothetical protein SKAU_G00368010 [Synaphobranchus kaupii]|uniref:Uncharacterized protein n=1 Tax=Synaphobranchus kaupii TaxID=118154 RepID=A0A9Q1EFK2_SYNKA|nr:hypothetical protein SKAU_G00368010 [Synaphobranchus kaupii]